jgi:hypothetical protein
MRIYLPCSTVLTTPLPELEERLLYSLMKIHAWASSRPKHESSMAAARFNEEVESVLQMEKQKGEFLTQPSPSKSMFLSFIGTLACIFAPAPSSIQNFSETDAFPAHLPCRTTVWELERFHHEREDSHCRLQARSSLTLRESSSLCDS